MKEKIKKNFYRKLNLYRNIIQIFSLAFLAVVPLLVINGVYSLIGSMYSYTIFGIDIVDPAMAIQSILLSREFTEVLLIGLIIPVLLALIFGKVFCSWMCPFNTLSEYWQKITGKIFKKRFRKSIPVVESNPKPLYYWLILIALFVLSVVVGFPLITFLSAPGIISSEISQIIMGMGFGIEMILILSIIFVEGLLFKRYWCKFVCPVGGVLSLFRFKKTFKVVRNEELCNCSGSVKPCSYSCPLALSPLRKNLYPFCYNCGECVKICEKTGKGALTFRFGTEGANSINDVSYSHKEEKEILVEE